MLELLNQPDTFWKFLLLAFFAGIVWIKLEVIRKDIARLEEKQEEANKVKMRMAAAEAVQKMHQQELIELKKVIYGNKSIH